MARKALKDTFAIEQVAGVEVRRQIMAGALIPSHYQVGDGDWEEVEGGEIVIGAAEPEPPPKPRAKKASSKKT